MATTDLDICNLALANLGEPAISSLAEASVAARTCNQFYAFVRDNILSIFPWSFAVKRAVLELIASEDEIETPIFGYAYAFDLPTDYLAVLGTDQERVDYKVEGGMLLADDEGISIRYISRADEGLFPAYFVEALAGRLSAAIAMPITQNAQTMQAMFQLGESKIRAAMLADARYQRSPEITTGKCSFLEARE